MSDAHRQARPLRLAYLVSHPIQYQAPLLRRIAREPGIDLTVLFGSDFSLRGYRDQGFGVDVHWDTPLLDGYPHEFLPALRDLRTRRPQPHQPRHPPPSAAGNLDALWVHGYASLNALHAILAAKLLGIPVLLRAESWLGDRPRCPLKLASNALLPLPPALHRRRSAHRHPQPRLLATTTSAIDIPLWTVPYAVDNAFFSSAAAPPPPAATSSAASSTSTPTAPSSSSPPSSRPANAAPTSSKPTSPSSPDLRSRTRTPTSSSSATAKSAPPRSTSRRHRSRRHPLLRLPQPVRAAPLLRPRHRLRPALAARALGPHRQRGHERRCPVIVSTDVGCHPDLLTDGVEGLLFPAGDIPALTAALRRILATPDTARQMGKRAPERIDHWSFEQDIHGLRQALAHTTGKLLH